MKAIVVFPSQPNSVHLPEMSRPLIDDVPGGRSVLVKVLRVDLDGTDKEINAAEYGAAPEGYDFLVIGHESFGRIEAVGESVTELAPSDYVVAMVRRPGSSIYDRVGLQDMTTDDVHFERGINLRHGFLAEYYVMVGTVNAAREHFEAGVRDMAQAEAQYPGRLRRLLTHPVKGLENYAALFQTLTMPNGAIKGFCEVAEL